MQIIKLFHLNSLVGMVPILLLLSVAGCQDVAQDEVSLTDPTSNEMGAVMCPAKDVNYNDHLAESRSPISSTDAGGEANGNCCCTTTLTASHDVTTLNISLKDDAGNLVWKPLVDWLVKY